LADGGAILGTRDCRGGGVSVPWRSPDTIILDGRAHSWQAICELRRQQLEMWWAAQPRQMALFELKDDTRPIAERTAAGRYEEPSLLSLIRERTR
jgi:hypothetical protein